MLNAVGSDNPLRIAGIPKKFWNPTKRPQDPNLLRALQEYDASFNERIKRGMGLVLFGEAGIGKSYALAKVAVEGIARKKYVKWIQAGILSELQGARWNAQKVGDNGRSEEIAKQWKSLLKADILVIDDFNRRNISRSPACDISLSHTLRWRLDNQKATFITSNHTRGSFKREFCEEWLDWLSEQNEILLVRGESLRPQVYQRSLKAI